MSLELLSSTEGHEDRIWSVEWSPDGKYIASASADKSIKIWEITSDYKLVSRFVLDGEHIKSVRQVAWHPHLNILASASFDGRTIIWKLSQSDYEVVTHLEGHENEVKSVAWNSTGEFLATCSRDKTIQVWDVDEDLNFESHGILSGHTQDVKFVKWHPTSDLLYSCSYDDSIKCWAYDQSVDDWSCIYTLTGHESTVWQLDFDSKGEFLATCGDDQKWMIWKISKNSFSHKGLISGSHSRPIYSISWSHSQNKESDKPQKFDIIATAGGDNSINVFDINRETIEKEQNTQFAFNVLVHKTNAHENDINCVRFNPQNPNLLASCSDDLNIKLWRVNLITQNYLQNSKNLESINQQPDNDGNSIMK